MKLVSTLHVLPGPVYNPDDTLKLKYEELSRFSQGTIVSIAPKDHFGVFSNYKLALTGVYGKYGFSSNLKLFYSAMREAYRLKKKSGLDIVICYDPLKTGLISYLIKKIFRCKMVVEVNGIYDSPELYKFKKGLLISLKSLLYPKIQRFILKKSDGIKCLFRDQVKNTTLSKRQKVHYFFDFTQIKKSHYSINATPTILSMGFPSYIKGMDLLITSFNQLSPSFPEWKLVLVGHFSDTEREYMTSLAKESGKVSIRKPVAFSEVPGLIDQCDIFVLASRSEGIPRVLIEAMARGRARVASIVGGIPEVIKDGVDGYLFESENINELSDKIQRLMESESLRKSFADTGLQRFENEYTITHYSKFVETLYRDVAS